MKLKREARILREEALSALRRSVREFNSFDDDGRASVVLRELQHAHEMLLKASLVQRAVAVFDKRTGQSLSFEKCVRLGSEHLQLTSEEAGTFRAIDTLRDEQQHWFATVSEPLLYLQARAGVTLFDDVLERVFNDRLSSYLPHRVLPLSAEPPRDIQLLFDEEYDTIRRLLAPGRRKRPDARSRIRTLLAMEAHAVEDVKVSKKDVDRVQKGILAGKKREDVFPRLSTVGSTVSGEGIEVRVRFVKQADAAPVRFVGADENVDAAAVREVDLQKKFHRTARDLAKALSLTGPRTIALRRHLGIDDDPSCTHTFRFGSQSHLRFSDNAFTRMREELEAADMETIWREYGPYRGSRSRRSSPPRPAAA
jgi:hypothetical protein